jgi:hypothetical protein
LFAINQGPHADLSFQIEIHIADEPVHFLRVEATSFEPLCKLFPAEIELVHFSDCVVFEESGEVVSSFFFGDLLYDGSLEESGEVFWLDFRDVLVFKQVGVVLAAGLAFAQALQHAFVEEETVVLPVAVDPKCIVFQFAHGQFVELSEEIVDQCELLLLVYNSHPFL